MYKFIQYQLTVKISKKHFHLLKFLVLMSLGYAFDGIGYFDWLKVRSGLRIFLLIMILMIVLLEKCGGS